LVGGTRLEWDADRNPVFDRDGDVIVAIDGKTFPFFEGTPSSDRPLLYLRANAGKEVTLTVRSADGTLTERTVTLRPPELASAGALGVGVAGFESGSQSNGLVESVVIG